MAGLRRVPAAIRKNVLVSGWPRNEAVAGHGRKIAMIPAKIALVDRRAAELGVDFVYLGLEERCRRSNLLANAKPRSQMSPMLAMICPICR
jgi:hypothetical protein